MLKNNDDKPVEKSSGREDEIDLRELIKIFIKRKWWFIGTFIIVLIAALAFTFFKTPEYSVTSILKISSVSPSGTIMEYYPELASNLKIGTVNEVVIELKSATYIDKVSKYIGSNISKNDLNKAINITVDEKNQLITITTKYNNPNISYKINKFLVDEYIKDKNLAFTKTYKELLEKIDKSIKNTKEEIEKISKQAGQSLIEFNLKLMRELQNQQEGNIYFGGVNYVSPILARMLDSKYSLLKELEKIKNVLLENEKFYTNQIELIENPEMPVEPAETNYKRNIIISLFLAIILGFGVVFVVDYFVNLKKHR